MLEKRPRIASKRLGSILLLVQGAAAPTDGEWESFLRLMRSLGAELVHARLLMLTRGGGLTMEQRKRLAEVLGKATMRVAVVTSSLKMRFTTSSLAFIMPAIRSFEWDHLTDAYRYLDITEAEERQVSSSLLDLRGVVGDLS